MTDSFGFNGNDEISLEGENLIYAKLSGEIKFDPASIDLPRPNNNEMYIVIAEFYQKESAQLLKKRIINELTNFDSKLLLIKIKKMNEIALLSGPYNSINLMKNDYIQLKNFGFEELDITIDE